MGGWDGGIRNRYRSVDAQEDDEAPRMRARWQPRGIPNRWRRWEIFDEAGRISSYLRASLDRSCNDERTRLRPPPPPPRSPYTMAACHSVPEWLGCQAPWPWGEGVGGGGGDGAMRFVVNTAVCDFCEEEEKEDVVEERRSWRDPKCFKSRDVIHGM